MIVYPVAFILSNNSVTKARCSPATITRISFIGCKVSMLIRLFLSIHFNCSACRYTANPVPHSSGPIPVQDAVFRVQGDQMHPLVVIEMLQEFVPLDQLPDARARC